MIKKVQEIRHFSKPNSVFKDWKEDTFSTVNESFTNDLDQMKIKKFIKDKKDLADTKLVLRKYYGEIKK